MSRFLNLNQYDAFEQFAVTLWRLRSTMERMYHAAVEASDRCNSLLKEALYLDAAKTDFYETVGISVSSEHRGPERARRLHLEAQVEDMNADWLASVVVLFADDALRRFHRRVLRIKPTLSKGYGPTYNDGVRLTTLLQAGGNAIRHVSEWDDDRDLTFPYDLRSVRTKSDAAQAFRNIEIFQRAFGKGKHEPIREMQSWGILCTMDGLYGTHFPNYGRVENAIVCAARDMAVEANAESLTTLNAALEAREIGRSINSVRLH